MQAVDSCCAFVQKNKRSNDHMTKFPVYNNIRINQCQHIYFMWKINAQPLALKTINLILQIWSLFIKHTANSIVRYTVSPLIRFGVRAKPSAVYEICVLFQLHMLCYLTHCFRFKTTNNYILVLGKEYFQIWTLNVIFHLNLITNDITIFLI